jgi:hypothetical protein
LVTPPIGSTPEDWIALLGQPDKQFQNFGKPVDPAHPTVNDKHLDLWYHQGDVAILSRSYAGVVSTIMFYALDKRYSKTGFTWDESNIWTLLQQYGIPPSPFHEYPAIAPGDKSFTHGDFEGHLVSANDNILRDSPYNSAVQFESKSLDTSQLDARMKTLSELLPAGLSRQFNVTITHAASWGEGSLVSVQGTVKNNSTFAVERSAVRVWVYTVDDEKRVLSRMDAILKPVSDGLFNPNDECKFESLVPNPDDRFKAAFTDVELLPFAMPVK